MSAWANGGLLVEPLWGVADTVHIVVYSVVDVSSRIGPREDASEGAVHLELASVSCEWRVI